MEHFCINHQGVTMTKVLITIFFFLFASTKIFAQQNYSFQFDGKEYEVIMSKKAWSAAAQYAVDNGGYLVQINSKEEQAAVYDAIVNGANVSEQYTSVMDGGGVGYVWIGATDQADEGQWLWDGDGDGNGELFWTGQGQGGNGDGKAVKGMFFYWGGTSQSVIMEPDDFQNNQDAAAIALDAWPRNMGHMGQAGEWNDISMSNSLYFVVEYPDAPDVPELNSPDNGSVDIDLRPEFIWDTQDGMTYRIQVATEQDFASGIAVDEDEITEGAFTPDSDLEGNTEYFWHVKAFDGSAESQWSETYGFTTKMSPPDGNYLIVYPEDGAEDIPTAFDFEWHEVENTTKYKFELKKAADDVTVLFSELSDTDKTIITQECDGLENNEIYEWRIQAGNPGGWSEWSDWFSFTTIIAAPETSPILISPADDAQDVGESVVLQWNAVENADSYDLEVYEGEQIFFFEIVKDTDDPVEYKVSNLNEKQYYTWRVRATNSAGQSEWSEMRSFETGIFSSVINDFEPDKIITVYPNPVSGQAYFNILLSKTCKVKLEIFDIKGIQAKEVFTGLMKKGNHNIGFDVADLSNGIYYYVMKYGERQLTGHIAVVK
jgi:hypothetical protein